MVGGPFISAGKIATLTGDRALIQSVWQHGIIRHDLLARYRIAWLLLPSALSGSLAPACATAFSNATYVVYRVE